MLITLVKYIPLDSEETFQARPWCMSRQGEKRCTWSYWWGSLCGLHWAVWQLFWSKQRRLGWPWLPDMEVKVAMFSALMEKRAEIKCLCSFTNWSSIDRKIPSRKVEALTFKNRFKSGKSNTLAISDKTSRATSLCCAASCFCNSLLLPGVLVRRICWFVCRDSTSN